MPKLYLVNDDNSGAPVQLVPTLKEAREIVERLGCDGEGAASIETIDVPMTKSGVCNFVHRRFGVAIFEN